MSAIKTNFQFTRGLYERFGRTSSQLGPGAGNIALAAGIAAPVALENDRGILASAAITTPLIGAAFLAAPHIKKVYGDIRHSAPEALRLARAAWAKNLTPEMLEESIRSSRLRPSALGVGESVRDIQNRMYLAKLTKPKQVLPHIAAKDNLGRYQEKIEQYFADAMAAEQVVKGETAKLEALQAQIAALPPSKTSPQARELSYQYRTGTKDLRREERALRSLRKRVETAPSRAISEQILQVEGRVRSLKEKVDAAKQQLDVLKNTGADKKFFLKQELLESQRLVKRNKHLVLPDTKLLKESFDHAYRRAALRPGAAGLSAIPGGDTVEDFFQLYQKNKNNPVYAQQLARQIRQIKKNRGLVEFDVSKLNQISEVKLDLPGSTLGGRIASAADRLRSAGFASEAAALEASAGRLASGAITDIHLVAHQVVNRATGETLNKPVGVRFLKGTGRDDIVEFGLTVNNRIYTGKGFSRLGVTSRFFYQDGSTKSLFEAGVEQVAHKQTRWREIQREISRATVWQAGGTKYDNAATANRVIGEGLASVRRRLIAHPWAQFRVGEFEGTFRQMAKTSPALVGQLATDLHKQGKVLLSGSEGATLKGSFLDPAIEEINLSGVMSPVSQDPAYRAMKLEVAGDIPEHLRPVTMSGKAVEAFGGASKVNRVYADIGGYTNLDAVLFGKMSSITRDHIGGNRKAEIKRWAKEMGISGSFREMERAFQAQHPDYQKYLGDRLHLSLTGKLGDEAHRKAVTRTMGEMADAFGRSGVDAATFDNLYAQAAESAKRDPEAFIKAIDYYAGHGETEVFFKKEFYEGAKVRVAKTIELDRLNDIGEDLITEGKNFGKVTLGWKSGKAIQTAHSANRILEVMHNKDTGKVQVVMEEIHDMISDSSKFDTGVKGLSRSVRGKNFEKMAELHNLVARATGIGELIDPSLITGLAPQEYFHVSGKNSFEAVLNQAIVVAKRAQGLKAEELARPLKEFHDTLSQAGFRLKGNYWESPVSDMDDAAARRWMKADNNRKLIEKAESLIQEVGGFISRPENEALVQKDRLFANFLVNRDRVVRQMAAAGDDAAKRNPFATYLRLQHGIFGVAVTDSTALNPQTSAAVTHDMLAMGVSQGKLSAVRDLIHGSRTQSGDPAYFDEVWTHVQQEGSLSKPLGDVFEMRGEVKDRAGTVFDPTIEANYRNRSVKLQRAAQVRDAAGNLTEATHLPLVSMEGFGGKPNEVSGELKATYLEKAYNRVARAQDLSQEEYNSAVQEYLDEIAAHATGKKGHLRARSDYERHLSGYLRNYETLNVGDSYISTDMLDRLGKTSPELQSRLLAGEDVLVGSFRHPVSDFHFQRIKYRPDRVILGKNQKTDSMLERILFRADSDMDRGTSFIFDSEETAQEIRAMAQEGGPEWKKVQMMAQLRNPEYGAFVPASDIYRAATASSLAEEARAGTVELKQLSSKIASRWEGRYVGHWSHMLDKMRMAVQHNPQTRFRAHLGVALAPVLEATENLFGKDLMEPLLFQMRQVPIQAAKSKMTTGQSRELLATIGRAWDNPANQEAADEAIDALRRIALGTKETTYSGKEALEAFPLERYYRVTGSEGEWVTAAQLRQTDKVNMTYSLLQDGSPALDDVRSVLKSDKTGSDAVFDILTRPATRDEQGRLTPKNLLQSVSRKYREAGTAAPEQFARVGRQASAHASASGLGLLNEALSSAAKEVKAAFRPAGPVLAVGAGLAVLAGAALSQTSGMAASPPPKLNRPETTFGETDRVPGEPVEGSMSGNPPRQQIQSAQGVRTTVVAPVNHSYRAEVRMEGEDRTAMSEVKRRISSLISGGGNVHVTNNYQDSWNSGGSRLRRRERIQKELDRYDR